MLTVWLFARARDRNGYVLAAIALRPAMFWLAYAWPLVAEAYHLPAWNPMFLPRLLGF